MQRDALIRAFATCVAVDPTNCAIRQVYAELLIAEGRGAEALEQCAAFLAQRPDDPEVVALQEQATELCERSIQTVIDSIPDSIDELLGLWDVDADIDLTIRANPDHELPRPPLGRLTRPVRSLDSLGGVDSVRAALRALEPGAEDNPAVASLTGVSGFTMYGPPGAGKQTLIEAFAAELGAECLTVPVDELLTAMLDGRAIDIRQIIDFASTRGRVVLHLQDIEELWAGSTSHMSVERARLAGQIATALDRRIHPSPGMIVVATSTRPWRLPAPLVSETRLGRSLFVPPPDLYARAQMIWSSLGSSYRDDVDVWELARHSDGFSGDDIARACRNVMDRANGAYGSGITARVTTKSLLEVLSTAETSIDRWIAHARLAVATSNSTAHLGQLIAWLNTLDR